MENAIQLFAFLILTFLGVITPIIIVLMSIYHEGIQKLTTRYLDEKSQKEKVIKEQLERVSKAKEIQGEDVKGIEQSLSTLKLHQKKTESKLTYLNPKGQIVRLFVSLFVSFSAVLLAILTKTDIRLVVSFLAISLICLVYTIFVLWKTLDVIIEAKRLIDDDVKETKSKTIELLSILVEKAIKAEKAREEESFFLKNVYIMIDDFRVKENEQGTIVIEANKKQQFRIGLSNLEKRMAKNVEIGFIFSPDFIIEKTNFTSLYTDKETQIVRFEKNLVQGTTKQPLGSLILTPLREGKYNIKTFIKAENIESTYRNFNLEVTRKAQSQIISSS
jgi:ABC-type multidrug transport system fused ATPase/permease subunit